MVLDVHAAFAGRRRARRDRPCGRARRGAPRAGGDRRARAGGRPAGHRRAAAGRGLPSVPRARARERRRADRRGGGRRTRAGRPLAGRVRRLPRPGRPPPVRQPRRDRARARAPGTDPPVQHRPGPAFPVPRSGRRHRRARDQRSRARAREADAVGLPDDRGVRPARGRRARCVQPGAPEGGLARWRRRAGRDADVRPRAAAERVHRAAVPPCSDPRAPAVPAPARR